MKAEPLLKHTAGVLANRELQYGPATALFERVAKRWSITLGHPVTAAQVALCMIDLKLARLTENPSHLDSVVDIAGYAAVFAEVTACDN